MGSSHIYQIRSPFWLKFSHQLLASKTVHLNNTIWLISHYELVWLLPIAIRHYLYIFQEPWQMDRLLNNVYVCVCVAQFRNQFRTASILLSGQTFGSHHQQTISNIWVRNFFERNVIPLKWNHRTVRATKDKSRTWERVWKMETSKWLKSTWFAVTYKLLEQLLCW